MNKLKLSFYSVVSFLHYRIYRAISGIFGFSKIKNYTDFCTDERLIKNTMSIGIAIAMQVIFYLFSGIVGIIILNFILCSISVIFIIKKKKK